MRHRTMYFLTPFHDRYSLYRPRSIHTYHFLPAVAVSSQSTYESSRLGLTMDSTKRRANRASLPAGARRAKGRGKGTRMRPAIRNGGF